MAVTLSTAGHLSCFEVAKSSSTDNLKRVVIRQQIVLLQGTIILT